MEPPAEHRPPPVPGNAARRFVHVAAGVIILFLFLRSFAVEPFGVPTGSMAPTLIGNHREGPCPRCGFPVRVGEAAGHDPTAAFADACCPNCGKRVSVAPAPDVAGDRLLVDKNVFNLRRPRRWEVAVFRCPADLSKPYVKRVVGLPGEVITIDDGEVFADRQLLRKGLAEVRECRLPFFDLNHPPKPAGWAARWSAGSAPVDDRVLHDNALFLDASASSEAAVKLTYRQRNVDDGAEEPVRAWNPYNGAPTRRSGGYSAHDFILECDLDIRPGDGIFACRLFDGMDPVAAEFAVGNHRLPGARVSLESLRGGELAADPNFVLRPGRTYHLEFAFVDRRVSLAVDGKEIVPAVDLDVPLRRGDVSQPAHLGAQGCHIVVRNLRLYQDIYYTPAGRNGTHAPCPLGRDEYFFLGDNSGNSQDSREWAVPGVPEVNFIGKPFLIHQPLRAGRVTVAGRDRAFQTVDWSRLRWLH